MADAAVWITGSGPDKQLNFRLPTGGIGPQGPKGADGSNVLPTSEAIEQAITTPGPTKTTLDTNYAGIKKTADPKTFGLGGANLPTAGAAAINTIAIGTDALNAVTTGINNIGIGNYALEKNISSGPNLAIGHEALRFHSSGDGHSVAVGNQSQRGDDTGVIPSTGTHNHSFGVQTLWKNQTGVSNVAIGFSAMRMGTAPSNSVGIGQNALYNSNGNENIAIGINALFRNTTGAVNVAIGNSAIYNATTAVSNVGIGIQSLYSTTTGNDNTAVGASALRSGTTATKNTAVGAESGRSVTTGSNNSFIGYQAGYTDGTVTTSATVSKSVAIGYQAQATTSNTFVVGSKNANDRLSLLIGNYDQTGGGKGLISLSDAATLPITNPVGGGLLYSEAGALKWRGSAGTVTVIAPA